MLNYSIMNLGKKRLSQFERFDCVDIENTIHNTNFTTPIAALSTDQAILPCALNSEVWSFVGMGDSSKSTFLHLLQDQRDIEFWDSLDDSNFPPLYALNFQESCIFLFLLRSIWPLHLWKYCLEAHFNPNNHCSTQFHAVFLYTKMLALVWV